MRLSTVMVLGAAGALIACGGGMAEKETATVAESTTKKDPTLTGPAVTKQNGKNGKPTKEKAEPPPGVAPFKPGEFSEFIGIQHGSKSSAIRGLLPKKIPSLGKRSTLKVAGSAGYEYPSHLVVSWQKDSERIEYVSVRSKSAIAYLEAQNRADRKLTALWNITTGQARGLLGEPNENIDRPHARTFRYQLQKSGRRIGVLSLAFSKLSTPPRLSTVSVHWQN